jgi:hypothetical protein
MLLWGNWTADRKKRVRILRARKRRREKAVREEAKQSKSFSSTKNGRFRDQIVRFCEKPRVPTGLQVIEQTLTPTLCSILSWTAVPRKIMGSPRLSSTP